MHWSERYVGMPYVEGDADCAALAARVQREVFGRAIGLPADRAGTLRGLTRQIEDLRADYAERTDAPADGDGVLMIGRGRLDHIGLYCLIDGTPWVLHAMRNAGAVVLHRLSVIDEQGLRVEGFYRWI